MKRFLLASVIVFGFSAAAYAQQQASAPVFVPFTVNEQDLRQLRSIIDEHPMKYAMQVMQWMEYMEQRAIAARRTADEKAAEKPKQ